MRRASASSSPRPARPHCCHSDARVPGQPATMTASRPLISMPSSSALVVATARSRPSRRSASRARRSSARYPPRYAATDSASSGATSASSSRARCATTSAPRRERTKARVRFPSDVRSARTSAVSASADLRGAGWSGSRWAMPTDSGGSQSTAVTAAWVEPSTSMGVTGAPMRREAASPGAAMVAEAQMTMGSLPCRAANLRSRLMTCATCEPNIPR